MMKFPTSFRQSLTLHFVAAAVLPLFFLGIFGLGYFEQKHLETTFNLVDAHALNVSHEAGEFLHRTSASLFLIEKILNSGVLQNDDEINQYLQLVINQSGNFESIYLLDKDYRITNLGLSDGISGNYQDSLGMDLSTHAVFSRNTQLSEPTWSDTFLSYVSAEPSITLGIPLQNGTLLGTVSLQSLSIELVDRLGLVDQNFRFALIDHHGILIADSQPGLVSQRPNLRLHPEVRHALDHHIGVSNKFHEDGSLLESVYLIAETGWAAYVSLPMQDAMIGVSRLRYLMFSLLALAASFAFVLSFWLSRRMLKPVLLLRDAAGEVARGNYHQPLQKALYRELEDLSSSFREMAVAIAEREQAINVNHARYCNLVNSIDGIVWELDLAELRFTFVSDQAEQILGYPTQRWLEEKDFWINHVHHQDREWVLAYCQSETDALRDHDFEYRMIDADGRTIWLKDIVSVVIEAGRPVSLRGVMINVSRRKKTEQYLNEITARLQLLIERMPFGCIMWDQENRVELWNPAAEKIFGFTKQDAAGIQPNSLLGTGLEEQEASEVLEWFEKGDLLTHSIRKNLTKSGHTIICEWHNTPLKNSDGSRAGMISMVRDITEMKEAEMRMVRSEARFRKLIAVMGEGLIIVGNNGEVVQCNQAAEKILRIKAVDLIGKFHEDLIRGAIREDGTLFNPDQQPLSLTLLTGEPVNNKVIGLSRDDGQIVWLQVNTHDLGLDRNGKPLAIVCSFSDVTRLKDVENELRENESYLQTLSMQFQGVLEAIPDRIMMLDMQMRIVWMNWFEDGIVPVGQKLLEGVCCYELPGIYCAPSLAVDPLLCDECPVKKSFTTGCTESFQKELSDGSTISQRAFPVFDESGEIINVIQIAQDITESLRHQTQAVRTGQLAALGELAAGVAHEINNPINGVINYAQLILNKAVVDSREAELSQRIIRESERVAAIVRELLFFAREESQEVNITSVSAALNDALALTLSQLNKEGIQLQVLLPQDLPEIKNRSHQIQQLFLNLISNSRYALSEKYPDSDPDKILLVKGEVVSKEGRPFVAITFRDHGVGIDADFLPRVLNPFTTTKSSKDGTGLGLSISHKIVQKHNGTLSINSVHGEFTEVVVELPAEIQ